MVSAHTVKHLRMPAFIHESQACTFSASTRTRREDYPVRFRQNCESTARALDYVNQFAAPHVSQFVTSQQDPRYNMHEDYSNKKNRGRQIGGYKDGEVMDTGSTARSLPKLDHAALGRYFSDLLSDIREPLPSRGQELNADLPENIAELVFRTISGRRYCYLSRKRSAVYRDAALQSLAKHIALQQPIRFYYDIGGGYHAGINPTDLSLTFEPGLGEILMVRQISLLARELAALYPHGIRFTLVIDNLCALLVNDIPLEKTEAFVRKLRAMIQSLDSPVDIDLLVESEHFSPDDYDCGVDTVPAGESLDTAAMTNVSRFLGRHCGAQEASMRIALYHSISEQTDRNINSLLDDIRMTQRATPETFPFRPFPGGASRIQAGELALFVDEHGNCKPALVTTENYERVRLFELDLGLEISGRPAPVLVGVRE